MAFTVVYDACVLYPASVRDLLMRIAQSGVVRARWTDRILDECFLNLAADRPDLSAEHLTRTRRLMCEAVPDCLVRSHTLVTVDAPLPDPNDRHVLVAAVACGAQAIVTFNLTDFPASVLAPFGMEAKHPDAFVLDAISVEPALLLTIIEQQRAALRRPPITQTELYAILRARGLVASVALLEELGGTA